MPTDTRLLVVGELGADYVRLTGAIKAWLLGVGASFVIRYAVPPETTHIGKNIDAAEVAWLHDHGIAVLLNWEINPRDGDRGTAGGRRAGDWLRARAAELGCPVAVPLFCSIDTDTTPANIGSATDYVRAFAAAVAPHPFGVYGDTDIAGAVADLDPIVWRANARAWGPPSAGVHVQQHLPEAPGVDRNRVLIPFAAWQPSTRWRSPMTALRMLEHPERIVEGDDLDVAEPGERFEVPVDLAGLELPEGAGAAIITATLVKADAGVYLELDPADGVDGATSAGNLAPPTHAAGNTTIVNLRRAADGTPVIVGRIGGTPAAKARLVVDLIGVVV